MSTNKYMWHLQVLVEDDANRQIANGFLLEARVNYEKVQILPTCGGWLKAVDNLSSHWQKMRQYEHRRVLLLLDFDEHFDQKMALVRARIPLELAERVFLLGTADEPERLRTKCKMHYEQIGRTLARECADSSFELWRHEDLRPNQSELDRLSLTVKVFLFNLLNVDKKTATA